VISVHFGAGRLKNILLVTDMAMSAAWMVKDGVIKVGGAEPGLAMLMLLPSANSG